MAAGSPGKTNVKMSFGKIGGSTLIVAVLLSAVPDELLARTQKLVEVVKAGVVKLAEVAPSSKWVVSPLLPSYHWNVGDG